jgi:hypothetical protein
MEDKDISAKATGPKSDWLKPFGVVLVMAIGLTAYLDYRTETQFRESAKIRLQQRPETLRTVLGMPLPDLCDGNGTLSDDGRLHCVTAESFRVWTDGAYTRLGEVHSNGSIRELLRVRPEYLYSKSRNDYAVASDFRWAAVLQALQAYEPDEEESSDEAPETDIRVMTPKEIELLHRMADGTRVRNSQEIR